MSSPSTMTSQTTTIRRQASGAAQSRSDDAIRSLPIQQFIWGAGIECSFLPHLNVDQFQWTQHNRVWRDDFKLARDQLGVNHLRYALPWHVLEPERRRFDWSMADERIAEAQKLGLNLMLDV